MNNSVLCVFGLLLTASIPAARAQVDLSGNWGHRFHEDADRIHGGPSLGDYTGLPINAAARLRAQTWDDAYWSVPEHQCEAIPADYAPREHGMRVWSEVDPKTQELVAWHVVYLWQTPHRVIWMDGRQRPPAGALHTWMGFSTGQWVGDTLVVTTTHMKAAWIRRNGVPKSDLSTLTEYWTRHGNYLSLVSVVEDPVYLTAPFVRTEALTLDLGFQIGAYQCSPKAESDLPRGFVAYQLPQKSTAIQDFAAKRKLPLEAAQGGAQTMYPEFLGRLRGLSSSPTDDTAKPAVRSRDSRPSGPSDVEVLPVRDNLFALLSASGNTTVQSGDDGVLLVDTQRTELSQKILQQLQKLSSKPLRNIIDTSADMESSGANAAVAKAGRTIGPDAAFFALEGSGAAIYAHENVLRAMSASDNGWSARDPADWPTDVYFGDSTEIYFNGEAVRIIHMPAAHTDGDSIVYFRRSDVISTGGVFLTTGYPVIDVAKGGSINGEIEALNRIIDITVPEKNEQGGTLVIPGRGRISDEYEVVAYRDMITIIRDRVIEMIRKGLTLEQIQDARPTQAYDGRYGADQGPWTTHQFVEAIYRSLMAGEGT
jgi:glyoxylase-like metal-dependent hydrolase (beta-lactamase superfamily II)